MKNIEIKVNKEDLNVIFMALQDSNDLLNEKIEVMDKYYCQLTVNEKNCWRNSEEYNNYKSNFLQMCYKQKKSIYELREKLNSILENDDEVTKNNE